MNIVKRARVLALFVAVGLIAACSGESLPPGGPSIPPPPTVKHEYPDPPPELVTALKEG